MGHTVITIPDYPQNLKVTNESIRPGVTSLFADILVENAHFIEYSSRFKISKIKDDFENAMV